MKKIVIGTLLFLAGYIVPGAGIFTLFGLGILIWGLIDIAPGSSKSDDVDIGPLATTDDLNVFHFTGMVVGIQRRTVINNSTFTSTTGGGGYLYQGTGTVFAPQSYSSSSTSSIEVVRYFVKDDVGEFSFELNNPPLAVREGHRLSSVYAGNSATSTKGWLAALVNYDTGKSYMLPHSAGVEKLIKPERRIPGWLLLGLTFGSFIICMLFVWILEVESLIVFALLTSIAILISGLVKNNRAVTQESLTRNVIVTSIQSHVMELISSDSLAKLEASLHANENKSSA